MSVSINYTTNFKRLNRMLFVGGEAEGRATIRVSEIDTHKVLEELCHVDAADAMRTYRKLFNIFVSGEAALDKLAGE